MSASIRRPAAYTLAVGFLILVFLLECFFSSAIKSPSWDETGDIAAGLSYIQTGKFTVNPQHPPLLKELIGLFALASGARWPDTPQARQLLQGDARYQWAVGSSIIAKSGPDQVMFWARLPMILLAATMALLLYVWGRQMLGPAAALGSLFLFALDPNVIAHSYLTTLDAGFAAFTLLFLFVLWRYLHHPSTPRLLLCGLALGLVLVTKFSAVLLLPVAGLLIFAATLWPPAEIVKLRPSLLSLYAPELAVKTGPNDACPCGSGRKFKVCHGARDAGHLPQPSRLGAKLTRSVLVFAAMCLVAFVVVQATYFFSSDPLLYLRGISLVNADHDPTYPAYLADTVDTKFLSYFAVAWLLKEPLPTLALVILGLVTVIRRAKYGLLDKLFLLGPAAVLFVGHTLLADPVGIRYILPAMVLTYLAGGVALAELLSSPDRWKRVAALVLCLWAAVAAAGAYPDHLSYFNEAACLTTDPGKIGLDGGSRCGPLWLDDSNVDWGEGLKQLKAWWDGNASGRAMRLAYFGSFPPEAYGLHYQPVSLPQLMQAPSPGLYAVSAHLVARAPALSERYTGGSGAWLRRTPPHAIVGHCFYIYDIR
jgi:hypothetical protein